MSIVTGSTAKPAHTTACNLCGAQVSELRRGRCWGCYVRWSELRPVGLGAACGVCDERRRDNLRLLELHGRSVCLCHNCASRTLRLHAVPDSLDELRGVLTRDRRRRDRRGSERTDHRLFPRERRVADRRSPGSAEAAPPSAAPPAPAPYVPLPGLFDDLCVELSDKDLEAFEPTLARTPERRETSDS